MKCLILHIYVSKNMWSFILFEEISQICETKCASEWEFRISAAATEGPGGGGGAV